ncbi:hypothetical protein KAJ89_04785 [Candidatus Parcubacteria bacterium]|nr:hypothetical protein [Candidatus Parcubacteria bacterium]
MEKILNEEISALPILIGSRLLDCRDIEAFSDSYRIRGYQTHYCEFWDKKYNHFNKTVDDVQEHVEIIAKKDNDPLAVFLILTWNASKEAKRLIQFIDQVSQMRKNIFVYPIIWGSGSSEIIFLYGYNNQYLYQTNRAAYLYFNSDAQTAGAERLNKFITRVLGHDLPDKFFPNYSMDIIQSIAAHINQESFNVWGIKSGAIPKYPIREGKPYFPVLQVKIKCPHCGEEKTINRTDIDKNNGAEITCYHLGQVKKVYFEKIGEQFDSWPEFDDYIKEGKIS